MNLRSFCVIFVLLLFILAIMPVAAVPNPNVVPVDPAFTGITLIDDSITSYHYIPKFSWVHYTSFSGQYGVVEITTYPDAGYNQSKVTSYTELGYPDINLQKSIEIPNGAIVSREFINTPYSAAKEQDPRSERFFRHKGLVGETTPNTRTIVTYNNETILVVTWDDDASHQSPTDTPDAHWWAEWAELVPTALTTNSEELALPKDAVYTAFTAEWNVPQAPTYKSKGQKTYIFNGFSADPPQTKPNEVGIVQPVLAWNCGERNTTTFCQAGSAKFQWTGMAVTCYNKTMPLLIGKQILVSSGDRVQGSMTWKEELKGWDISFKDLTTGGTSSIVSANISNKQTDLTPVLTLESYGTHNICKNGDFENEWPQNSTIFRKIDVKMDTSWGVLFDTKPHYNVARFTDPKRNEHCKTPANYPAYADCNHYYVDIRMGLWDFLDPRVILQTHSDSENRVCQIEV
jgi:hypothetical protein